jgi:hypothetical protein
MGCVVAGNTCSWSTVGRRRKAEDGRQKTEDRRQRIEDCRQWTAGGDTLVANSGVWWQMLLVELYGCGLYESHTHHQMERADLAGGEVCVVGSRQTGPYGMAL